MLTSERVSELRNNHMSRYIDLHSIKSGSTGNSQYEERVRDTVTGDMALCFIPARASVDGPCVDANVIRCFKLAPVTA